jgi:hypothetical protein
MTKVLAPTDRRVNFYGPDKTRYHNERVLFVVLEEATYDDDNQFLWTITLPPEEARHQLQVEEHARHLLSLWEVKWVRIQGDGWPDRFVYSSLSEEPV